MISNQCFIINKTTLQEALKLLCIPSLLSYSCILVCLRKPFQNSFFFLFMGIKHGCPQINIYLELTKILKVV